MNEPELLGQRLQADGGLPGLLAAGWDTFDFLQVTASGFDDAAVWRHAYAFLLAAGAASRGRHAVGTAPSLPAEYEKPDTEVTFTPGEDQAAETAAALAGLLERRLAAAGASAADPGDRAACAEAAAAAAEIRDLLAGAAGNARASSG
jgi:hypothetical protein